MKFRSMHNRRSFCLESLEIRNAPSHFGGLAPAAVAVHAATTMAHVRHPHDAAEASKKDQAPGLSPTAEEGKDVGSTTGQHDTESTEFKGVDPKGER